MPLLLSGNGIRFCAHQEEPHWLSFFPSRVVHAELVGSSVFVRQAVWADGDVSVLNRGVVVRDIEGSEIAENGSFYQFPHDLHSIFC